MARYASSQGKGPKKKKRDTNNRASVRITQRKDGRYDVSKRNDGDPSITRVDRDRRKTVRGPDKKVKTTSTRSYKQETAKSKGADLQWQNSPTKDRAGKPIIINGKKTTNKSAYTGSGGTKYPPRGTSGRPKRVNETKTVKVKGTKTVKTTKPNKDYNKKGKPSTSYSDKAKNPGGYPFGLPKIEQMSPEQMKKYRRYLN